MKKKVAFYTIGCKLNYAETSTISRKFSNFYYQHVSFKEYADIYVINSCSVTKNAENEFKRIIRSALSKNNKAFIIAIGCYAQLNPKKVYSIIGVNLVLNDDEKYRIIDFVNGYEHKQKYNNKKNYSYYSSYSIGENRTRSFLKIQDGCDYKCSYCIIPQSRGPSRSDYISNILNKIKIIFKKGIKEIVLTGINIGDYGKINGNSKYTFFDLIQSIEDNIKEGGRIRLSSIEPNLLKNKHIEFLSKSKFFVPHFHIPLQSGSNKILGYMRRRYKKELFLEKVKFIRYLMPYSYIGSDVIVGYPGETYKYFIETYNFLEELDISSIHIFTYSSRQNTLSSSITNGICNIKIKKKRNKILRLLSNKKYIFFCKNQLFTKKTVLFEKFSSDKNYLYGYTENYIRAKIRINKISILYRNTLQNVVLNKIDNKDGIVIVKKLI